MTAMVILAIPYAHESRLLSA